MRQRADTIVERPKSHECETREAPSHAQHFTPGEIGFIAFCGEGGFDTGLANLCAYRRRTWHGPLPCVLNVWVAPLTGATPFLLAQERCANEGHPAYGFRFAQLPSLRCCSGVRLTWAIPGPLSLSPHPCGSSPCATPPLGLLTGPGRELAIFPLDQIRRRLLLLLSGDRTGDAQIPFRRPSGIAA